MIRRIRIGASTPKKWRLSSALIKLVEGTEYSHFFMVMEGANKLPFDKVAQASYGDVHLVHYDTFKERNNIFFEVTLEIHEDVY